MKTQVPAPIQSQSPYSIPKKIIIVIQLNIQNFILTKKFILKGSELLH